MTTVSTPPTTEAAPAPTTRKARNDVFCYTLPDGAVRYADPLRLEWRFTQALGGDPDSVLAAAQLPKNEDGTPAPETPEQKLARLTAEDALGKACLFAFDLPELNPETGEGWVQRDALRLLWGWLRWGEMRAAEAK